LSLAAVKGNTSSRLTKGYTICIIGTVIWSTTAIFIRYLSENSALPPLALAFWRDLFVAIGLFTAISLTSREKLRLNRKDLYFLIVYGLELSIFNTLWTVSVYLNGAAVSTVLAYSSAAFTALLGWRLMRESLGPAKGAAVTLSMLGCIFVSGAYDRSAWQVNTLGIVTGLFSGIAFAVYSLFGKKASQRSMNSWVTLAYTFLFGSMFLLVYNLASGWLWGGAGAAGLFSLGSSWNNWLVLVSLAIGPTIGGYGLYTLSLSYLPASVANLIATLEPAITAILAYLLLNERFSLPQMVGSACIIGGVLLLRMSEGRVASSQPLVE
jgi:drug/metabolite transporter (DMT)-like permease